MSEARQPLDLLFLGSGNAFGAEGRAFSSFLLNGRYLFDCGPTVLQQLSKAGVRPDDIEVIFISHFHADHYFGIPFFFLDARYGDRTKPLTIVGPPGIEERVNGLMALGYRHVLDHARFERRYIEVDNPFSGSVCDLSFTAREVKHVPELQCFAFRAEVGGRSVVYSGDTTLCGGLLDLARDAEVVVVECSCKGVEVHLSPEGVERVAQEAPQAKVIVTHLDGHSHPNGYDGLLVADDLKRFRF